ncbi:hypothetical protein [Deinococcus sp. YIM 77859]|uniref:hypothetical protein n=1 Tax=Deinococcus sp. YIM 77859 TaxID=1540221 RepID=UPI00054E77BB|nr:hypothetical protein [Deinococcus sp. YIM 77859]
MAAPNGTRARVLRLYRTFSSLDIVLVSRALGIRRETASAILSQLASEGRVLRAERYSQRRPYVRTEYHREVR